MASMRFILLLIFATTTGCQLGARRQEAKYVEPVLPTTMSRVELVEFLNAKTEGLKSWRCVNTQVHVKSPDLPFPQKLKGTLACSAPGQFRLVCDNTIGHADFGSNENICWAYVKPGESVVMTWKHEDSSLLQHLPGGMPRLEPNWLMTILGIQPIDLDRFELQKPPLGSRELWLVAVEDAPDGTSLRRVIKVDTVLGVARLHALYDSDANPLLMAHLSDYKSCGGHELPHTVRIEFPATETQLTLKFTGIEADCQIAPSLWMPPQNRNIEMVDLGHLIRTRMQHDPQFAQREGTQVSPSYEGQTALNARNRSMHDGVRSQSNELPEFDQPRDIHLTGDERYFGDATSGVEPGWDDDEDLSSDERFERALIQDSAVPEFDIIGPQKSTTKRRWWFPFRKP